MLNLNVSFAKIFGMRPSVVESRSQALHTQRSWLEDAAKRKRGQEIIDLARELDLEKTQRLPMAQRGFTLLELMISVGIVALLVAIALPAYASFTTRSMVSEGIRQADSIETAVSEAWQSSGLLPNSAGAAGVPATISGRYVSAVGIYNEGVIGVTFGVSAPASIAGLTLTFTPNLGPDGNSLVWTCGYAPVVGGSTTPPSGSDTGLGASPGTNVPAQYLPKSCRT